MKESITKSSEKKFSAAIWICFGLWFAFLMCMSFQDSQGIDFYPLYVGAEALKQGINPYSSSINTFLLQSWEAAHTTVVASAVVYPIPVLAMIIPLTWLPVKYAVVLWSTLLVLSSAGALLFATKRLPSLHPQSRLAPLLFVSFYPLFQGFAIKNCSVLWLAIALLTLVSRSLVATMCACMILPWKPQAGGLFAAHLFVKRYKLLSWRIFFILAFGIWGIYETYCPELLQNIKVYRSVAPPIYLFVEGAVALFLAYRIKLPAAGIIAIAQAFLSPANDFYLLLPLLVCWICIGGNLALMGSLISWSGFLFFKESNSFFFLYFTIVLPLIVVLLFLNFSVAAKKSSNFLRPCN